ncbi:condensation domain-containing protein [Amycolatopsis sp. GM8]|uniref:condensation domain-containing protein n=1 Tax=Amycolatopsis sp. GM8 TaxID=2896530 RepID=UPI002104099B|nr:condensation domain-containing protein [Amycolatopsis sp. GM8]
MTTTLTRGPLSIQQESALHEGHGRDVIWKEFELQPSVSPDELRRRVDRMMDREPGLRAVAFDRDGVTYADHLTAPLSEVSCADDSDVRRCSRTARDAAWEPGGPLWRLVVFTRADAGPSAVLVVDHLIADVLTVALMVREISTGVEPDPARGGGRYDEWVRRQRGEFDLGDPDFHAETRQFWNQVLAGAAPRRATGLPGVRDAVPGRGAGTVALSVHVPVDAAAALGAARKAGATPFTLAVASFAATIAAGTGVDDLSCAIVNHGRAPGFTATYGWLATSTPLRVTQDGMSDFGTALAAVCGGWKHILPRLHTPWQFVNAACAGNTDFDWGSYGRRQLIINYMTDPVAGITDEHYRDKYPEYPRDMPWIELQMIPLAAGGHLLRFLCNSDDVDPDSMRTLLRQLAEDYTRRVNTFL